MADLGFNPVFIGFALASLGYAIGLAIHHLPLPGEGKSWGGSLISYSLLTAVFLAIVGAGQVLSSLATDVSKTVAGAGGLERVSVEELPFKYFNVTTRAMGILAGIATIGTALSLTPIVGPAISGIISVLSTLPSMALTGTMILSLIIAVTTLVFVTFAPVMIPLGIVLLSVPGGKLRGLGGWFIAMSLALSAVGPLIPAIGVKVCNMSGMTCTLDEMTRRWSPSDALTSVQGLTTYIFNIDNNDITKLWVFTLGSMVAFSIMSVAAAALSRAIGGIASSLGIG
jgi:hypothetical protein